MPKRFHVHSPSFTSLTKILKFSMLSMTKNLLWQEMSQALTVTLGGILPRGRAWCAACYHARELRGPWAVGCSWSKMIDLESYLNASKASEPLLLTALGCCVAICSPKPRVNWVRPPLSHWWSWFRLDRGGGCYLSRLLLLHSQQPFLLEHLPLLLPGN